MESIVVEPSESASATVIWLHGLGADGHDFEPIVPLLNLNTPTRFILPHAPIRPVTINAGMEMRAWYDIDLNNPNSAIADIEQSVESINEIVQAQSQDVEPSRIVLAGFSQGGVIVNHLALRSNQAFAGVLALSTYIHEPDKVQGELSFASADTPFFFAHGTGDPMIPLNRAVQARDTLTKLNYKVEWHTYPMGHEVCQEEISDISNFLNRCLPVTA